MRFYGAVRVVHPPEKSALASAAAVLVEHGLGEMVNGVPVLSQSPAVVIAVLQGRESSMRVGHKPRWLCLPNYRRRLATLIHSPGLQQPAMTPRYK